MKKVRFKDLFNFDSSSKLQAGLGTSDGNYPFYTSSPTLSKFYENYQFSGENLIFGTGGTASIHYKKGRFAVSSDCLVAIPNDELELFHPKYIFYYLSANLEILQAGFRGAGLKHISRSYIANITIPLPDFSLQNQIVAVLDKAHFVFDKLKSLNNSFEDLEKSLYYDMFGKKNTDFIKWKQIRLDELVVDPKKDLRTGPFGSDLLNEEMKDEGDVRVLGIDNVVTNRFGFGVKRFINQSKYNQLKKFEVFSRDVIITIMGTLGRSVIVPNDLGKTINTKHLAAITLDESKANPFYISYSTYLSAELLSQLKAKSRGAVMDGLNLTNIKSLKYRKPPLDKQLEFERLITSIWNIKAQLNIRKDFWKNLIESIQIDSFSFKLKTNINAFSFDNQMVDYIEKKENIKSELTADDRKLYELRDAINSEFYGRSFSYTEVQNLIQEIELPIEYDHSLEYQGNNKDIGIKDFIFKSLSAIDNEAPFLKQVFIVDKDRDAEKNKDNSCIMFEINTHATD